MKIKFTESVTVPAGRNEKELRFKEGSIHDLSEASAWRWVRRNLAVYYKVEVDAPKLKVGRPMMGDTKKFRDEMAKVDLRIVAAVVDDDAPKKRGRPKKGA